MKSKVAIILPTYNVTEHLDIMINSLYESTNFPFKLIVVDGYSTDTTFTKLKQLAKYKDNVEIYQIPRKGLVNAINFGIKKAGNLDCYLTQPDVIHYKKYKLDWLAEMYIASKNEGVGMVTGLEGWSVSGPTCINGFKWIGTWNAYISRKTINKIGLFDEQFFGNDDIDYSYRVVKAGLKNVVINYWVHHHQLTHRGDGNSSSNLKKMGELFRKKWKIGEFKNDNTGRYYNETRR